MSDDDVRLIEIADKIDNRLGPLPGGEMDRLAVLLRKAAERMAAVVAERDAALAPKPAAPTGETVRVRVAVWVDNEGGMYLVAKETDVDPYNDNPTAWITADVPIPVSEIAGTVEVTK